MALNNTSKIVGLKKIAELITIQLNDLSDELYDIVDSGVNTRIVFNITANAQEYDTLATAKNLDDEDVLFTPGILERIDLNVTSDQYMSMYNEAYSLNLYGYYSEMEEVRIIFDKYTMAEKGLYITINEWLVKKSVQTTDFVAPIDPDDGSGLDRFMSTSILLYQFLDNGIHASKVVFKIDDIRMPFYTLSITHQKDVKTVILASSNESVTKPNSQTTSYNVNFPLLASTVPMEKIAKEIGEGTWGNSYKVELADGVINNERTMLLVDGSYTIEQDGIVVIEATLVIYNEVI